jgi:DNA repair protein RadC
MALSAVEITLIDHMVIADEDFVSMRQSGVYDPNRYQLLL